MYYDGKGVPLNYVEARRWFQSAAKNGSIPALLNLAQMCYEGWGGPHNYVEALMWWDIAAARGSKAAVHLRDNAAKHLSEDQVAEAKKMASGWIRK